MSGPLAALTSRSEPGLYAAITLSGTTYRFRIAAGGAVTMLRTPDAHSAEGVAESVQLYRDAEPLPVADLVMVVGLRGKIVFWKPDRVGTRNDDGTEYACTTRSTSPVLSIRRIDNERDL